MTSVDLNNEEGTLSNSPPSTTKNEQRITSLRYLLENRPRNARAMSELACLLAENAKTEEKRMNLEDRGKNGHQNLRHSLSLEALDLARKASEIAPTKPFGYAALSRIESGFEERMKNLKTTIEYSSSPQHIIARTELLIRLLIEPRNHEAKKVEGKIGKASNQHPNKRDLSKEETALYLTIRSTLEEAWQQNHCCLSEIQIKFLAQNEYRLGVFFRKKVPARIQQKRSRMHFIKALENLPETTYQYSMAKFWLATIISDHSNDGANSIQRCPKEYIVGLYSTFAASFDHLLLGSLQYVTPRELRRLVDQVIVKTERSICKWARKGADLGCGTGLSGQAFRDCVNGSFVGVDLSPEMLAKAKHRSCYDDLMVGDCLSLLTTTRHGSFDLILACDVFVYIGDLRETFAAAHNALSEKGIFAFSTELLEDSKHGVPFRLQMCARFAHSGSYVKSLATDLGFEILAHRTCPIRKNEGKDVQGLLFVLSKT